MIMTSEDNLLIKQLMATHAPDGREVDVKPILEIVEAILNIVATSTPDVKFGDNLVDKAKAEAKTMLAAQSYVINRLSSEISYNCMGGVDGHSTSVSLLNILSNYSWDAKLVLTLAAFALNYGEFWLLAHIYSTNRLASRMAILKQVPVIKDHSASLKPQFEVLNNLNQSILELSKCIISFSEIPSNYISKDNQAYSAAVVAIPLATYWIFRSVIASATNIAYLSGMGHKHTISTNEAWELSNLTFKTKAMNELLRKQLATCQKFIEEKKHADVYEALVHAFEVVHVDNLKILGLLLNPMAAETLPLVEGTSKKRVALDVLRSKTVLLLISDLDIPYDELSILEQIYRRTRDDPKQAERPYEVVWIPVVDLSTPLTDTTRDQFETLQARMPWYSVYHPSSVEEAVIRFINKNLHFKRKTILVVFDPQGKMVSPNALHMMWIWGSSAFPFTSSRVEALWNDQTWRLELLVGEIDAEVLDWIREGKHIILYGSDDIAWTQEFFKSAHGVANDADLPLEMIYVGKSSNREQVERVLSGAGEFSILGSKLDKLTMIRFWTRLESMLSSMVELQRADEKDQRFHEIKKLLSYDQAGPWALLSKASQVILIGDGTTVLSALQQYGIWKKNVPAQGFDSAFKDHYEMLHQLQVDHPFCRFEFETPPERTPEHMECPQCLHRMDKFATFSCCHD